MPFMLPHEHMRNEYIYLKKKKRKEFCFGLDLFVFTNIYQRVRFVFNVVL